MQFNNNECVCNTLLKSLNDLVSTMLNVICYNLAQSS